MVISADVWSWYYIGLYYKSEENTWNEHMVVVMRFSGEGGRIQPSFHSEI